MTKKNQNEIDFEKPYETNISTGKMGYYIWHVTGLVISIIGVFLIVTGSISNGVTSSNEIGEGGGQSTFITGPGALILGLLILASIFFIRKNKTIS
jgi:hypothetical protein